MIVQERFGKLFTLLGSRSVFALTLYAYAGVNLNAASGWADLSEYVRKPEPAFEWQLKSKIERSDERIYDLQFVSQVWQGEKWRQQLQIYRPANAAPSAT